MFNLFDIMQNEGGGAYGLGQQFGLSPDQSRRAMEALLPALTIGLQRNAASDPAGLGRMFGLVGPDAGSGRQAQSPLQMDVLSQLFGSPALAQAVLQQASSASGIGTQALRQMLPIMAGMVVAGIVHVMLNQPPPAQPVRREPEPKPAADFVNAGFWNDWMNTFLSSPEAASPKREAGQMSPDREKPRPFTVPDRRDAEDATPPPPRSYADASTDLFQQMFQSGIEAQEQNVKAMQDLFDSFWASPAPRRAEPATPAAESTPQSAVAKSARQPRKGRTKSAEAE